MKKKCTIRSWAVLGLIISCLLIGVIGCSSKTTPAKNDLKVLESSGIKNTFKVGDTFNVVLKGNPSTGFAWYYTIDNNDVIELSSNNNVPDKNNVAGSASTYSWSFKALKTGQVKIIYRYYQGWLGEASVTKENTIEYLITVAP